MAFTSCIVVFLACAAASGPAQAADESAPLIGFLAHCESIRSVECRVSENNLYLSTGKEYGAKSALVRLDVAALCAAPGPVPVFEDSIVNEIERRTALDGAVTESTHNVRRITAYDGQIAKLVVTEADSYKDGNGYISNARQPYSALWLDSIFPFSQGRFSAFSENARVTGTVEWNGETMYVVETRYPTDAAVKPLCGRLYLDPSHDFAMCHSEWYHRDGRLLDSMDVLEFVRFSGVWLPAKCRRDLFRPEDNYRRQESVEYLRLNASFSAADFDFTWPPGCWIKDERTGEAYQADSQGNVAPLTAQGRLDELLTYTLPSAAASQPSAALASSAAPPVSPRVDAGAASPVYRPVILLGLGATALAFVPARLFFARRSRGA